MKSCSSRCSSASSSRGRRAATMARSDPGGRSLWPALPGSGSRRTIQVIPVSPVSTDKKGRETLELSRLRSARELEGMKENRQEICNASCCSGKVYLGPPENLICPRDRTVLQPVRSRYSQISVPGDKLLATGRMNALRQGRKRKLPQLWGLLTWKLNRAAEAQRYQVPKSPW